MNKSQEIWIEENAEMFAHKYSWMIQSFAENNSSYFEAMDQLKECATELIKKTRTQTQRERERGWEVV